MISLADFQKVDIRVGVVVDAQSFPEARQPAFRLWIDFGALGVKRSSAPSSPRCSCWAPTMRRARWSC